MELIQVKNILHQTVGGDLFMDGMGCSEPILSINKNKIIDNFMAYFVNFQESITSGPVVLIGVQADNRTVEYINHCDDKMFSLAPRAMMKINFPSFTEHDYEEYRNCYKSIREIAYKRDCCSNEKKVIRNYFLALKKVVAPEMLKLYEEFVPEFFEWIRKEIRDL